MGRKIFSFKYILTVLLTVAVLILGGLNVQQKRKVIVPDDGCSWIASGRGIEAQLVVPDGPAARAGIQRGDILKAIKTNPDGAAQVHQIETERQVAQVLYEMGAWSKATYTLTRGGSTFDLTVVTVPLAPRQRPFLEFLGLLYFVVGMFVLIRRSRAPLALHFYAVCLTSFVLYVFQYTGKLNGFDWTIFWFHLGAYILLPPLFLHFCLEFPIEHAWLKQRRPWIALLYLPGALLLTVWAAFISGVLEFDPSPLALRNLLETAVDFHFGVYLLLSAGVLIYTYRRVETPELRQQMKWVTRGTVVAVTPYFLLQSLPRLLGAVPGASADFAIFPLVLIPLSFGYAIHRYRLMDVDIIFKRGVTYTLAGAFVIGLYAILIVTVGDLMKAGLEDSGAVAGVIATVMAALLFAPIKDQLQIWLDRFFYGERYDVRQTLMDFGRTLGSEVNLERMMDRIVDRLGRALYVNAAVVFLEQPEGSNQFVPAQSIGIPLPEARDFEFLSTGPSRKYFFFESDLHGLNYFIPCHVKDRVIAFIGLSRTQNGDYLTSEDLELLEAVSDYIGIALENARLYQSIEHRAAEYQSLKDFSENIIESINVGVVVEDQRGCIAGWNRALEGLTGRTREQTLGLGLDQVIPQHFLQQLSITGHVYKQRWNDLTVSFSATPLTDKAGIARGTLIIIDNMTERVRLEDQLIQNEKLTSIGLLAAGVAHEVNTPLAVISSYSQMLRKEISPEDSRYRLLEKITKQTFRASEIVNNLLNFSRTTATAFTEVDVHQVINETLSLLDHQFKKARIEVHCDLHADYPMIVGNAGRLQQVFLNLFLNAKDAMPEGGELRIRAESADSKVEILVQDTGMGINREDIKKIYDPFFTTKAVGKGTGLGLSVSYGIVQEHGGNITVESQPGMGSKFKLELPLIRKAVNV